MSKKTVYQCEMCYGWHTKDDINMFKKVSWSWRLGRWIKTEYDICDTCLNMIEREAKRERIKCERERGGIDE